MKLKFGDKVALVTGGESGIGASIALEFASLGCNIILTYLNDKQKGLEILKRIHDKGSRCLLIKTDVSNEEDVKHLFKKAAENFSQVDFLVNSAGIRSADKPLYEMSFSEFENTIRTNLFSVFLCCKYFIEHRATSPGSGRIINITSIHEDIVSAGKTDYCSSKFAIKGFSRVLALELAPKQITVNCIAPGMILTQMNQRALDDINYRVEQEKRIPLNFAGLPEDVAKTAVFFASDDARYITGSTQIVDGGLMLNRVQGSK
ncbi:SDR family NAD(P)-dependent oxidoreductase [Daejeonella sp.]|uniref:SDR family NAD(P)-dependent oxidoreductase n=1 Tax=Daejeonella sp. TaxID=2805397 RepID=UPI0025BAAADA|nr:SDR family NAD(P)-dependent oxidoreductase [Daejeonella sp.]